MSLLRSSYLDRFLARSRREQQVTDLPTREELVDPDQAQMCAIQWMEADGSQAVKQALIGCQADNGIVVKFDVALKPGTEVGIFGDVPGRAVVTFCRPDEDGYVLILSPPSRRRRRSEREPATGTAELNWRGDDRLEHTASVEIRNLSADGMQVAAPEPVPVSSLVRVAGQEVGCLGTVCYCWSAGELFLLGIQFVQAPYLKDSSDYASNS